MVCKIVFCLQINLLGANVSVNASLSTWPYFSGTLYASLRKAIFRTEAKLCKTLSFLADKSDQRANALHLNLKHSYCVWLSNSYQKNQVAQN
jgi:hypothetical protein